jgi:hypothetical protein
MEPVSILSSAAAISAVAGKAWELGTFVRELYQGAKTVDGRVRRLESAVTELARACERVQGQFESMSSSSSCKTPELDWDEQGALTASIETQVKACRRTLKDLRRLSIGLRPSDSSIFGRTSRHMKLQDRVQQIDDFSMRVKTHTDTLQMPLQIVIIKIALATPDFMLQRLWAALEDLGVRLSRIEHNTSLSASRMELGKARGPPILQHAQEAFRRGTTLYETSMAGSVADVEPANGSERAARIQEWADKVDSLRRDLIDARSINRPSTVSADDLPEKGPYADVAEKLSDTSPVGVSVNLHPVDELTSVEKTNFVQAKAAQDISLGCNGERLLNSDQPIGVASIEEHVGVPDATDGIDTDTTRLNTASPSPHCNSRSSSTNCINRSLSPEPTGTTPHLEATTDKGNAVDQDTTLPTNLTPQDVDKAKGISSQQTLSNTTPMKPKLRTKRVKNWKIEINGQLEASICTGNGIEPATLSKLVPSQAASTVRRPATNNLQPREDGLALLLAVFFCDLYLIKPLVERGYSPHARMMYSQDRKYISPMKFAIASRCEPVIKELLDNVPVLPCDYDQSLCRSVLDHKYLRSFPPTGVESIKRVIDLLMPARSSAHAACRCSRSPTELGPDPCYRLVWLLIHDACNMPSHLHDYRLPLVTHLLKYTWSPGHLPSYRVLHVRLTIAVILGLPTVVASLFTEMADDALLRTWLQKDLFTSLLNLAIRRAKNLPKIPLDTVRVLLEMEADLPAKNPADHTAIRSRKKAVDLALESERADLIALVESYSKA